jgi:threonine-phosphate decarboxylase
MHNVRLASVMAEESDNFRPNISRLIKSIDGKDTVFICNPNNPTGSLIPKDELEWLCRSNPDANFIVDESYLLAADGILFFMVNPTAGYRSGSMMIFKRSQFPYFS